MELRIGLVKIPIMLVNVYNNSYNYEALHQFSKCCKERVNYLKVCSNCEKKLTNDEILKGTDKEHILSDKQEEKLKEALENSIIEVISIKELEKETLFNLMPFILKSQIILPSLRKGFKKRDIKTFYSFVNSLKELNKYCIAKLTTRGKEHLIILLNYKNDFMSFEIPFSRYYNNDEISRLKQAVKFESTNLNIDEYKEQAKKFINEFKKDAELDEITEEKKTLLKLFLENKNEEKEIEKEEDNCPFSISNLKK